MTRNSSQLFGGGIGQYIPQYFAQWAIASEYMTNLLPLTLDLLTLTAGPDDNEHYHECWANVLDRAKLKDNEGRECVLVQADTDGTLWCVPVAELAECVDVF